MCATDTAERRASEDAENRDAECGSVWACIKQGKTVARGEAECRERAGKWYPLDRSLYRTPGSPDLRSAIRVPELAAIAHQRYLTKYRTLFGFCLFYLLCLLVLSSAFASIRQLSSPLVFLAACTLYLGTNYFTSVRVRERLARSAEFFRGLLAARKPALGWLMFLCILSGSAQWLYHAQGGDLDQLVIRYGIVFAEMEGEYLPWWRYPSGSFIHGSAAHWMANTSMLAIAMILAEPFTRSSAMLAGIFFLALFVTALCAQAVSTITAADGLVGISGGVFAVYGWTGGLCARKPECFPRYFSVNLAVFIGLNLAIPYLMNAASSLMAHLSGLIFGLVAGYAGIGAGRCVTDTMNKSCD